MVYEGPFPSTVEGYSHNLGYQEVRAYSIDVEVTLTRGVGEEAHSFIVEDDSLIFVFVPDNPDSPTTWRIVCEQLYWPDLDR